MLDQPPPSDAPDPSSPQRPPRDPIRWTSRPASSCSRWWPPRPPTPSPSVSRRPPPNPPGVGDDDRPGDPPPPPPHPIFEAIDLDGDGKLSEKEIAGAAEALRALDANKDGVLTRDELRPQGPPPPPPPPPPRGPGGPPVDVAAFVRSFLRYDKDGDGKVTTAELPERMARSVEQGDTNQDKALERSEIEALSRKPPARRPPGNRPPPRGEGPPPPPPPGDF